MGTGSYSNDDWGGLLYPEGTKKTDYLRVYAQHYNAVEINSSFYNIPGTKAFAGMAERAGGRLQFAVKLHQTFTHLRHYDTNDLERMLKSPAPLREQGILGPFLAQFPYSFHRTAENRKYLWELTQHFGGEHLALELRHGSWDKDEVREGFSEHGLIWVSPDYPRLEGMTDSDGRATGEKRNLGNLTLTAQYKLRKNLMSRLELRHDASDRRSFETDGSTARSQNTVAASMIYTF